MRNGVFKYPICGSTHNDTYRGLRSVTQVGEEDGLLNR